MIRHERGECDAGLFGTVNLVAGNKAGPYSRLMGANEAVLLTAARPSIAAKLTARLLDTTSSGIHRARSHVLRRSSKATATCIGG